MEHRLDLHGSPFRCCSVPCALCSSFAASCTRVRKLPQGCQTSPHLRHNPKCALNLRVRRIAVALPRYQSYAIGIINVNGIMRRKRKYLMLCSNLSKPRTLTRQRTGRASGPPCCSRYRDLPDSRQDLARTAAWGSTRRRVRGLFLQPVAHVGGAVAGKRIDVLASALWTRQWP
jgi:hypothetical protein